MLFHVSVTVVVSSCEPSEGVRSVNEPSRAGRRVMVWLSVQKVAGPDGDPSGTVAAILYIMCASSALPLVAVIEGMLPVPSVGKPAAVSTSGVAVQVKVRSVLIGEKSTASVGEPLSTVWPCSAAAIFEGLKPMPQSCSFTSSQTRFWPRAMKSCTTSLSMAEPAVPKFSTGAVSAGEPLSTVNV